ncbi:GAF and ANTAR domain-containing protein [Labedaea rhizosphaerae]|uniref:ANTAR domain-containing protein n=1 Tax=Labedaea rhizosphaerae TaxID=598644 RepID=A0A4R6SB47_LABRH|nr:GAF and ANTAR domain-containing protein [Labedaea rhizosphaerae]TDP96206.1 hypothetical protein EV186_104188 [Labedaea rhizosphaerae]
MDADERQSVVWSAIEALAAEDGVAPSVQHACRACVAAVSAIGGGVSMAHPSGVAEPLFATDAASGEVQLLQFTVGQGPCVDALAGQRAVLVKDIKSPDSGRRWPLFSRGAVALGVGAVFSFPIQSGAIRFGVLDLYRRATGGLSALELTDALLYADAALALALDRDGDSSSVERLLDVTFVGRQAVVHQAAGMVSVQLGMSIADGMARLRAHAFAEDRQLGQVAADVVARKLRFHADGEGTTVRTTDETADDINTSGDGAGDASSPDSGG